jgi:hypothetical protein
MALDRFNSDCGRQPSLDVSSDSPGRRRKLFLAARFPRPSMALAIVHGDLLHRIRRPSIGRQPKAAPKSYLSICGVVCCDLHIGRSVLDFDQSADTSTFRRGTRKRIFYARQESIGDGWPKITNLELVTHRVWPVGGGDVLR